MAYVPKVKPPLDEIEVENRYARGGRGEQKPYLVVSMSCLELILARETSIIAEEDVPILMAGLCQYAIDADISDTGLARQTKAIYEEQAEPDE